jgi:hypothetical protein
MLVISSIYINEWQQSDTTAPYLNKPLIQFETDASYRDTSDTLGALLAAQYPLLAGIRAGGSLGFCGYSVTEDKLQGSGQMLHERL